MSKRVLFFLVFGLLLAACGGEEAALDETATAVPPNPLSIPAPADISDSSPIEFPPVDIPPLEMVEAGPIRPGCGDYRLLVTMKTDALGAGARVAGLENAVDVVWNLDGPGLALTDPPAAPRIFNEDNREIFGIEGNEANESVAARYILLVSGVRQGETLTLEMGQEAPGPAGTTIIIANASNGFEDGPILARFQVNNEYQTGTIDLCAAEPMPAPAANPSPISPRIAAFFYPWWGTTAAPNCAGDASGWQGEGYFVTPHTPIAQDDDWTIYQQTGCWMEWMDENGRTGHLYDVTDSSFLAEQMQLAQAAGIDAFAVSVHGDNKYEMNFLAERALPTAASAGFRIVALYEAPEGGWAYDDAEDTAIVGEHLRRIMETAAQTPAYLTLADDDPRLVIFIDPAIIARLTTPEAWATVRAEIDKAGVPYFLWGGPAAFTQVFTAGLDGVFNDLEVIETFEIPLELPPYTLRDERRLAYRATAWGAREQGIPFALPVVSGWDTGVVRPGDSAVIPRDYGRPGDDGAYYRTRWEDALENNPDWIVITSWNEWAEGTEIEPSDVYPPSRFNYLAATKEYACVWRSGC